MIGAGPIGAYFAARLAEAGIDVTLHGRGPVLRHVAAHGLRLARQDGGQARTIPLPCMLSPPPEAGWEMVIFAVKAQDLPAAARQFARHVRDAVIVLPQNGLPWWQFLGTGAPPLRLHAVDPDGDAERALPLERIAGCTVTKGLSFGPDATLVEAVVASDLFALGDVVAGSGAADRPAHLLAGCGLPVRLAADIRLEKWRKLLINAAFNPLGAISHLGFGQVLDDAPGTWLAGQLMEEALRVARACGLAEPIDTEAAFARARGSRRHKTSMLQDVEAGRRLELDPILGALLELAAHHGLEVPTLRAIYACLRLIDLGLVEGPIQRRPASA
ncbi:2-dehydropantoate 2-reductase [Pigmentiphaga sp. H8]|nr:2-dehydropantoate 2-reductase [Pigmentiphaga sp. H8]